METGSLAHNAEAVHFFRFYKGSPKQANRVRSAWGVASDCDVVMLIIDAFRQVSPVVIYCGCLLLILTPTRTFSLQVKNMMVHFAS